MASDLQGALLFAWCLSCAIGVILNGVPAPPWLEQEISLGGQQPGEVPTFGFLTSDLRLQILEEGIEAQTTELLPSLSEIELVWVRCREDWKSSPLIRAAPQMFKKMTVIEKCGDGKTLPGTNVERIPMANFGYEGAGYIHFIVERYSNLSPWTVFVHGLPEEHNKLLLPLFSRLNQTKLMNLESHGWLDLNGYWVSGRHLSRARVGRAMDSLKISTPELGDPDTAVDMYCCMQHMVKDTTIRSRPLDFWKRFLSIANESHQGLSIYHETFEHEMGFMYEHSFHHVYGEPWKGMKHDHEMVLATLKNPAWAVPVRYNRG